MRGERGIREAMGLATFGAGSRTWEQTTGAVAEPVCPPRGLALDLQRDLLGRRLWIDASSSPGSVTDLLLDVLTGRVQGVVCRTSPESNGHSPRVLVSHFERATLSEDGTQIVVSSGSSPAASLSPIVEDGGWRRESPPLVLASGELQGARVVTRDGRLIGQVREIYLVPQALRVLYRVTASRWRRILGEGGFMRGDLPYAYSHDARRLFVPAEISTRQLFPTLSAAIENWRLRPSSNPESPPPGPGTGSTPPHP